MAAAAATAASTLAAIHATAYQLPSGEVVVRVQGEESATYRAPVHFIVLLDTSGSMDSEHKLRNVVRSLHFMLDLMTPSDELSLLTFSDTITTHFNRVKLTTENREAVRFLLQQIHANGSTNLSGGLLTARECVYESTTLKQGILLLTDGHANVGVTDPATLRRQAATLLEDYHGLTLSCVGYGTDHNTTLLTEIAGEGGGSYNVVSNLEDVATVFGDVLGGLQATLAQELKINVPPTATQLTPFPGHPAIFLGDLQAGGEQVVLLKDVVATDPIVLQAYETTTGRPIRFSLPINVAPTDTDIHFGRVAILRIQVVDFLKRVQALLDGATVEAERTALQAERTRLLEAVSDLSVEPNPLLALLRDELESSEQFLATPIRAAHYARQSSAVVSQHVSHLGYARGVRCRALPTMPAGAGAGMGAGAGAGAGPSSPSPPSHAPALMTTFSSQCQQSVSHQLRLSTATGTAPSASQDMDEID
jgi:Mg-chelatase subunit ChlD